MIVMNLKSDDRAKLSSFFLKYGRSKYENLPRILKQRAFARAYFELMRLLGSEASYESGLLAAMIDHEIIGHIAYAKKKWDTDHFGFGIGQVSHLLTAGEHCQDEDGVREELLRKALQVLKGLSVECIMSRVYCSDLPMIHTLEKNGFLHMDALAVGILSTESMHLAEEGRIRRVREQKEIDIESLKEIARRAFKHGHFFADRRFPKEKSSEMYARWIENACRGEAERVFVATCNGFPAGFVACRLEESSSAFLQDSIGVVDLIAVSEKYQGQGLGHELMASALTWFKNNQINVVKIGTHIGNARGIGLNQKAGFRFEAFMTTFHRWIDSTRSNLSEKHMFRTCALK